MATVITNLISAIPWIGQDIVESTKYIIYIVFIMMLFIFIKNSGINIKDILPTVGDVHPNALKKYNKNIRSDKKEYLSIPVSFLSFLVGLIDGDGYIMISKTPKGYITIKLVISLHLNDLSTLEYIRSVLKIGKISIHKDLKSPSCRLIISRTDLQEVFFPLLLYHNIFFLTETRANQFNLAMYILENNIKRYDNIPKDIPSKFELPKSPSDYTLLHFFNNWIVGFTCPFLYPGLIKFMTENPLTYKRIKKDFKTLCSGKISYNYLKSVYKKKQQLQNKLKKQLQLEDRRYYSTSTGFKRDNHNLNTELVVWGTNLCSTANSGRLTKIEKNMIALPSYQKSVLIGILLSDGHLASSKPHENPHLTFKQGMKNSRYVWFVYSILCHYCNTYPTLVKNDRYGQISFSLYFRTRGLPCLNELRSIFYIDKRKRIPENIYNLLTPVALAHLIMGDGSAKEHGLIICTDSYELIDIIRLMNVLMIKYNLDCRLRYHTPTQPRIYIREHSMPILRNLVKPYMDETMLYKLKL